MKHDLTEKWSERLLVLQAQLERETGGVAAWHWHGEARVLRFLLRRYGERETEAPRDVAASGRAVELSALERLSLLIPNEKIKHPRPSPHDRTAILARIRCARDEGRAIEAAKKSWLADVDCWLEARAYGEVKARRDALRLREREEEWERRWRERRREEREKRRR